MIGSLDAPAGRRMGSGWEPEIRALCRVMPRDKSKGNAKRQPERGQGKRPLASQIVGAMDEEKLMRKTEEC